MAKITELSVGDSVSWSIPKPPREPSISHGIITSINRNEEEVTIRVYVILEDGGHERSDRTVTLPASRLRVIADIGEKQVSARIERILRDKVEAHNSKNPRHRATLRMLEAVFRRGIGAYRTNPASVRGTVRSADQWALARVNAFMTGLRTGKFPRTAFDQDLLPRSHPLSSKKEYKAPYDDLSFSIPKGVKEEAQRGLDWVKEFGRGGTSVGRGTARYLLSNSMASPAKVRKIALYFPRHEIDKRAEGYRPGEDGYPSNGRIAWALWGGEAGKSWANKLKAAMDSRDEKFRSAKQLLDRREELRTLEWDYRTNRFEAEEVKQFLYDKYDELLGNWDYALAREYFKLLQRQVRAINKTLASNPPTIVGIEGLIGSTIDSNAKDWYNSLIPLYESMTIDFAYLQVETLLPDTFKEQSVFSEAEQRDISRERTRRPTQEIIREGFYPARKRGTAIPIDTLKYNRDAKAFIQNRLDTVLPDMSATMKRNLNTALRKSIDEANRLGLTGRKAEDFIRKEISGALGKKNLGRALNIARTEGTLVSNWAQDNSATATGLNLEKEWLTRRDGLVRDSHALVGGKRVGKNSSFRVGGYKMFYPGDSSQGAPAGLVCNCRCSIIYHEKRI